ncbi:MAG: DUF11 domain-containing protein [Lachnospiraceae bacterium]|nr:DUF11 domain-containing protein [Lachnospiraceae bacterium]
MKRHIIVLWILGIFIFTTLPSVMVYAWGDNEGGRPEYTIEDINNGAIGDTDPSGENYPGTIVFNSISDSVIGHEFNFVAARECILNPDGTWAGVTENTVWNANDITVEDGHTYVIRLYVHNNNPNGINAISYDTKVAFSIPSESAKQIQVNGFITSSNATPSKYWDYVDFTSDTPFHLDYIYGSAFLENNAIGLGGVKLSDDVVQAASGGIMIGYDKLDGRIPGCYEYDGTVGIRVRAVFDYDYTVDTQVRLAGEKEWQDIITANVGDKVEFQIEYKNTSKLQQDDVAVRDLLPTSLRYVPGSIKLMNASHKQGATINGDALVDNNGLKIGNYGAGANAYIMFTAEVIEDGLARGSNTLVNWGQASVGSNVNQDYACVIVYNDIVFRVISSILLTLIVICLIIIIFLFCRTRRSKHLSSHPKNKD